MTNLVTTAAGRTARSGGSTAARRRAARRESTVGLLFVSPMVLGVIGLCLVPFVYVIWYSLHDWNVFTGDFTFIGLDNYNRLLHDSVAGKSLGVTAVFMIALMVINIVLAMVLALLLNQRLRGISGFRAIFF